MEAKILKYYPWVLIALTAIGCYVFYQCYYPYHFFYQEQNQLFLWSSDYIAGYFEQPGGLALLTGDFLTQFYYYLYAGSAILTGCILITGTLTFAALRNFRLRRALAVLPALTVMALLTVSHFAVSFRLSATCAVMGWALMLWLVSLLSKRIPKATSYVAMVAGAVAYLLFGVPAMKPLRAPDFILEKNFAVENEYRFGNHDKVIDIVRKSEGWNNQMLFFYNLVMAQRGQLPDHLLDFMPNYLGTFEKIGPETDRLTIINMNELYWLLGDMTFTERAAMMTNVFAPDNRNVRMIQRLAECNLVSGDTLAAEKYLRLLDKTFVYKKWADNIRKHGKDIYAQKMRLVNHHDTITVSDNAHFLMMQLLDAHPDNAMALDYILCSDLLLKDIATFKRDYDRYCSADGLPDRDVLLHRIYTTRLYQEALCIWLAGTKAPNGWWQQYIKVPDVLHRFQQYNMQRGSSRFRDTYWYYFDKIKEPKI